jgi:hypothetical protein
MKIKESPKDAIHRSLVEKQGQNIYGTNVKSSTCQAVTQTAFTLSIPVIQWQSL